MASDRTADGKAPPTSRGRIAGLAIAGLVLLLCCLEHAAAQAERRLPPPPDKQRTRGSRIDLDKWNIPPTNLPAKMKLARFESDAAHNYISYLVYLPPNYDIDKRMRYSVLYILPGHAGDCREAGPMVMKLDEAIRAGEIPPMIIIGVQGVMYSYYTDARDGGRPIETVIVKELIERIDNTFRTIPDAQHRALEGFSMGGFGVAHLAFEYPELFGVASMFSPLVGTYEFFQQEAPQILADVWGNDRKYFDEHDPYLLLKKNADRIRGRTKIRMYVGSDERYRILAEDLHSLMDSLKIDHEFAISEGSKHKLDTVLGGVRDRVIPFWKDVFPKYTPPPEEPARTTPPENGG